MPQGDRSIVRTTPCWDQRDADSKLTTTWVHAVLTPNSRQSQEDQRILATRRSARLSICLVVTDIAGNLSRLLAASAACASLTSSCWSAWLSFSLVLSDW